MCAVTIVIVFVIITVAFVVVIAENYKSQRTLYKSRYDVCVCVCVIICFYELLRAAIYIVLSSCILFNKLYLDAVTTFVGLQCDFSCRLHPFILFITISLCN